jgi:Protein of unknown function (DUF1572)/alpha/beta hydrolase fold
MRVILESIEDEYRRYKALGECAIAQLTDEQLCRVSQSGGNSVAALVRHISGNFKSRFTDFLTSDGEKLWRDRESEFTRRNVARSEVLKKWSEGWETLLGALASLDDGKLQVAVKIRGRSLSVMEALLDHLDIEAVVTGGLSMGGQIVMEFARRYPKRVRGLLLAATFPQSETNEGKRNRNAMADRHRGMI